MKKSLLSMIALVACVFATNSWALKVWMNNESDDPINIQFAARKGYGPKKPIVLEPERTRHRDTIFGTSLAWFSINGNKINVDQDGAYWYIIVHPKVNGKISYSLYRVMPKYAAKLGAAIAFAPFTGFYSLLGLPDFKKNTELKMRGTL